MLTLHTEYRTIRFLSSLFLKFHKLITVEGANEGWSGKGQLPDTPQSADTLFKLKILYGPVPAVLFWAGAAIFLLYPITKKSHRLMLDELAAKSRQ